MLLVIVPVVMNTIKNNDKRKYQDFEKAITNAAEAYVESNREAYPTIDSEGKAVVRLSYIINEGYLKSNIKDPSTKKSVSPNTYVTVLKQDDNTLEYVYGGKDCELSDSNETEFVGTAKPEDVLDGKTFYGNSSNLQTGILKDKKVEGKILYTYTSPTSDANVEVFIGEYDYVVISYSQWGGGSYYYNEPVASKGTINIQNIGKYTAKPNGLAAYITSSTWLVTNISDDAYVKSNMIYTYCTITGFKLV